MFTPSEEYGEISCDCCGVGLSEGPRPDDAFALCDECSERTNTIAGQTLRVGGKVEYGVGDQRHTGTIKMVRFDQRYSDIAAEVTGDDFGSWYVRDHELTADPASGECWTRVVG